MRYDPATDRYVPVDWDEALAIIARELNTLDDPNEAALAPTIFPTARICVTSRPASACRRASASVRGRYCWMISRMRTRSLVNLLLLRGNFGKPGKSYTARLRHRLGLLCRRLQSDPRQNRGGLSPGCLPISTSAVEIESLADDKRRMVSGFWAKAPAGEGGRLQQRRARLHRARAEVDRQQTFGS
jgi:anaerobic selenocysteine-containing dehydrogenase